MKIAANEKQKDAPKGTVFVVYGIVEYESLETLAVTTSRKLARLAIASDKAIRKAMDGWPFDAYQIGIFQLDTAVYRSSFFTEEKVRSL